MEKNRLLIIEDDPDVSMTLREAFELAGFKVETCGNGNRVAAFIENFDFSAVISRIQVPAFNIQQLAETLQGREAQSLVPIFLLTHHTDATSATTLRQTYSCIQDVFITPFLPSRLISKVRESLKLAA